MAKKGLIFLILATMLAGGGIGYADIYWYIDSDGVRHFSNTPTSGGYTVYMKEKSSGSKRLPANTQFDAVIKKAQKKYGIDSSLIKAVIQVESNFNPRAVSHKGAKGLMQIMPFNFKSLSIKDPFDPSENIMGGTLYLKRLFQRYENKLSLVLAAYNAGPDAVDRYKEVPPFAETQNFVRKVMKAYSRYKKS